MEQSNIQESSAMFNNIQSSPLFNQAWSVDAYINSLPSGYRFVPTDEELIQEYLEKKIKKASIPLNRFREINIYDFHPQELTEEYKLLRESEWYFFTSRKRKYPNGHRPNRAAKDGSWRATGNDEEIKVKGDVIGYKRTLDFYEGKPRKGTKTDWKMHEYRLSKQVAPPNDHKEPGDMKLDDCVLYKIYKNKRGKKDQNNKTAETEDSDQRVVPVENAASLVFSDQSVEPAAHQNQSPLIAKTGNVASHAFSYQSVQPHQDQSSLVGRSNPSTVLNDHWGMSTLTTTLNNKFGEPSYYESFQNGTLSNYSVVIDSFINGDLESAHRSHVSRMNSFYSPFSMQEYSRDQTTYMHHAMEYEPPLEVQEDHAHSNYKQVEGDDSLDALDQYLTALDDEVDQQHLPKL